LEFYLLYELYFMGLLVLINTIFNDIKQLPNDRELIYFEIETLIVEQLRIKVLEKYL